MLELRKVVAQVDAMSLEIARRNARYQELVADARRTLQTYNAVDDALLAKIERAQDVDPTWRGARPCDDFLDTRVIPVPADEDASLIGVDGSQIYPNRHGPALYFLINTGVIVLRQGSGQAPLISTNPQIFYTEDELYDDNLNLLNAQMVNSLRESAEIEALADWATQERAHWAQEQRLILALTDGPLLIWISEEEKGAAGEKAAWERVQAYLAQLQRIQDSDVVPVGYVARPRSANVLRLLHVAQLPESEITKERVRASSFRALTDTALFGDLLPNQRSALFSSTAQVNKTFANAGHEICFFYLNIARPGQEPRIARIDIPKWAAMQPGLLDRVHRAIVRDCDGAEYPYTLIRAHELALVTYHERGELEKMLAVAYLRLTGEHLSASIKEQLKSIF